jgi:hypothetical protein
MFMKMKLIRIAPALLILSFLSACETTRKAYYNSWEKMGYA